MKRTLLGTTSALAFSILALTAMPVNAADYNANSAINPVSNGVVQITGTNGMVVNSVEALETTSYYKNSSPDQQTALRNFVNAALTNSSAPNSYTSGGIDLQVARPGTGAAVLYDQAVVDAKGTGYDSGAYESAYTAGDTQAQVAQKILAIMKKDPTNIRIASSLTPSQQAMFDQKLTGFAQSQSSGIFYRRDLNADGTAKPQAVQQQSAQQQAAQQQAAQEKAISDARNASIQRIRDKMLEVGVSDTNLIDKAKDEIREAERKAENAVTKGGHVYASTQEVLSTIDYSKATPETDALLESMRGSLAQRKQQADTRYATLAKDGIDSTWSMGSPNEGQYLLLSADYTARPDGFIYDPNGKQVAKVDFSAGKIFDLSGNRLTGTQREYYDNLMRSARTITGDSKNAAAAAEDIAAREKHNAIVQQSQIRALLQTFSIPKEGTVKLGTGTIDSKGIILDANGKKLGRYASGQIFESPYQNGALDVSTSVLQALGMMGNYSTPMFDFSWANASISQVRKLNNGYTIDTSGIMGDSSGKPVARVIDGLFYRCDTRYTYPCVINNQLLPADLVSTYIEAFRIAGTPVAVSNSTITLSLPAAGEVKKLARGASVDAQGVLRNENGTAVGLLNDKGQFLDLYTKKPVSAGQTKEWLALFSDKPGDATLTAGGFTGCTVASQPRYKQKNTYAAATDNGAFAEGGAQ